MKKSRRRPRAYDRNSHELICRALNVSADPKAPGLSAYEGVCVLLLKLDETAGAISKIKNCLKDKRIKQALETIDELELIIRQPPDEVRMLPMYGWQTA